MKKLTFIILFIFLNVLLSCNKEETCGPIDPYFRVESMSTINWRQREVPHSRLRAFVGKNDTVVIEKYFVEVLFRSDYFTYNEAGNSNQGMLYALSCNEPGYKGSKEGIAELEIITLIDFNSTYQANDTITEGLEFGQVATLVSFSDFTSHTEFVEERTDNIFSESMAFRIIEPIESDIQTAQFKIYIKLTNGDIFESVTDSVKIRK
jgi:hypothetical protein